MCARTACFWLTSESFSPMLALMQKGPKGGFSLRGFTIWFLAVSLVGGLGKVQSQQAGTLRGIVELGREATSSPAIGPDSTIYVASGSDTGSRALQSISP